MTSLLFAVILAVHSPQAPARDVPVPSRTGSGTISGTVVTDDAEARPLRRVRVELESGTLEMPRAVVTDGAGRFVFSGLPPANYTLQAVRPTYVTVYYGSRKPGRGPGVPIAVADGQLVSGITLKMLKGAVITGVVRLPGGKPVGSLSVQASQATTLNGQRQFDDGKTVTTDDRGEYRFFGLAPGDYIVQATAPYLSGGAEMRRITPAEIEAAESLLRGGGTGSTAGATPPPVPDPGPSIRHATVYFPGATDPAGARTIALVAGQERAGVDLTLEFVRTSRISGVVIAPDTRPPQNLRITLVSKGAVALETYYGQSFFVTSLPDGSFSSAGIAPGRYALIARAAPAADGAAPSGGARGEMPSVPSRGMTPPPATLWASEEFDVNGRDVSGLVLRLQPGISVTGKLLFDSATLPLPDPARVRIGLSVAAPSGASAQDASPSSMAGGVIVTADKDGLFAIRGAAPGTYRLSVTPPGMMAGQFVPGVRNWVVTSIAVNGRDVADLPIEITPGDDVRDVVITLSDRLTEIAGTVFDQLGRPTPGFPIVVFATNREYWPAGEVRVRKVQPASDGQYAAPGLPPGEYYVCAVTDVDPADLKDPAFLESLTPMSIKITLTPGEKKALDLKLGGR